VYGKLVKLTTKAGKREKLIQFLTGDADVARDTEPGTLRFDVWKVPHEPDAVYLYEAYSDVEAFMQHQAHEPYKHYIEAIEPELDVRVVFDWADSLVSNSSPHSPAQPHHPALTKLSVGSFRPDASALANFNDYAELRRLTSPNRDASVNHVHFPPGTRTHWHRHDGQQLLWFTEGEGQVVLEDATPVLCLAGDIVRVPPGARHWHGALAERYAVHIAITVGETHWEKPSP
jgi:quercetin dioxygenase-like cupin family protein/quinol monooxygenase YgiN